MDFWKTLSTVLDKGTSEIFNFCHDFSNVKFNSVPIMPNKRSLKLLERRLYSFFRSILCNVFQFPNNFHIQLFQNDFKSNKLKSPNS